VSKQTNKQISSSLTSKQLAGVSDLMGYFVIANVTVCKLFKQFINLFLGVLVQFTPNRKPKLNSWSLNMNQDAQWSKVCHISCELVRRVVRFTDGLRRTQLRAVRQGCKRMREQHKDSFACQCSLQSDSPIER
jgi:hypothetical protein